MEIIQKNFQKDPNPRSFYFKPFFKITIKNKNLYKKNLISFINITN